MSVTAGTRHSTRPETACAFIGVICDNRSGSGVESRTSSSAVGVLVNVGVSVGVSVLVEVGVVVRVGVFVTVGVELAAGVSNVDLVFS
ncbi:MAG: hypothetical protein ACK2U3_02665 [Anaerolineales bacterium]